MAKIQNAAIHGGPKGKEIKLADEVKHMVGNPFYKWVTIYIYPTLLIIGLVLGLFLSRACNKSFAFINLSPASVTVEEKTAPQNQGITVIIEQSVDPNPASTPPPKVEVIEKKKRIYRIPLPRRQ